MRAPTTRPSRGVLLLAAAAAASAGAAGAASAADPAPPPVPRLLVAQPFAFEAGAATRLRLRGLNLTNATAVRITGPGSNAPVAVRARGEAVKLDGLEPSRVGDQRLEVEFTLPPDTVPGTNSALVVDTPAGSSAPFPVWVAAPGSLPGEKEPNNGFRDAPGAPLPFALRGGLEAAGDVDVFRVRLESGQSLHAEVFAARFGSTLDAMLTLYAEGGAVLASADDTFGRDPALDFRATATGDCFVAVSYANEKAAATHDYLLQLRTR